MLDYIKLCYKNTFLKTQNWYRETTLLYIYTTSKVTIITGPQCSALSEVTCVESTCMEAVSAYTWRHHVFFGKLAFLVYFWHFQLQILPQLKTFLQKSKCAHHSHTRHHICAKFDVPRPSQSWDIIWRKNSHPLTNPASRTPSLFRHLWTSVICTAKYMTEDIYSIQ